MIIVNMNNINSNINLTRRQKLITFFESFINILIIFPILCFYLYIKLKSSKLNIDNKNYKLDLSSINTTNNIYNLTFRNLNSEQIIDIIKKKHLIDTLTSNIYYGKWFTKSSENNMGKIHYVLLLKIMKIIILIIIFNILLILLLKI